jgi:diguanylate cyclase (GGDEF)-like protein/PAS domain S-box-containing protein
VKNGGEKMDKELFIHLIYNIAVLLTLALIYTAFQDKLKVGNFLYNILLGISTGIAGLLIMSTAVVLDSGAIFDARSILISVAGMFFGLVPTMIAGAMMILYRIVIGGAGMYAGILVILTTALIGLIWNRYRFQHILRVKNTYNAEFYLFGLVVHVDMLICMFAFPKDQVFSILGNIVLPVLILYPIATYLLCILLLSQYTRNDLIFKLTESEEKYRQIAENISDVIWTSDINFNVLYVSPSIEKLIGESKKVYITRSMEEKFSAEDLSRIKSILAEELEKEKDPLCDKNRSRIIEVKHFKPGGTSVWVSMHISFMRDENGNITGFRGMTQGIDARKKAEEERARQAGLIFSLIDSIPDLIFYKDIEGVYLGCNIPFIEFVGKQKNEIIGKTDYDLFDFEIADFFRFNDKEMLRQNQSRRNEEWVTYPDGKKILLDTLKTPYCDSDGNLIGILGISRDTTDRKQKEDEISYIGYHDHLTGFYNRRFFEEEKKRLDTERQLPLTVIIADMDGLKLINDGFGYASGDKLLIEAGNIFRKCCRNEDIISRIGGDEFCILLPQTTIEMARKITKRIRLLCDNTIIELGASCIKPSISMGYGTKSTFDENFSDIIVKAENSMRRRKLLERNSVRSDLMSSIKATMLEKSHETAEHAERMVAFSKAIGEELNLMDSEISELELAATLHDIGKMSIDEQILSKTGKLTDEEWIEIKKHPEAGFRIAQSTSELMPISEYILSHHERWDGNGYPQGLKGDQIPLIARIITVVDSYDAMTENRPYRKAMSEEDAAEEILKNAGTQFDPHIAKVFLEKVLAKNRVKKDNQL